MIERVLPARGRNARHFTAVLLGIWAAAAALSPNLTLRLVLLGAPCVAIFSWWVILRPGRWLAVFFLTLLLLPPLPVPWGNTGVHVAPLLVGLGCLTGLIWIREWLSCSHPFSKVFAVFLFILLESVCLAAIYSGWQVALGSLARVFLFATSGFVFLYTFAGPVADGWAGLRMAKLLYWVAVAAAAFACLDFYFQFPAPGRFSEQFIYLDQGVLRRAQGFFYEASMLGNFCAFFLVMVTVWILRSGESARVSRRSLAPGAIVLAAALMLSYSRASVLNLAVALCVLFSLRVAKLRRSFGIITAGLLATVFGALMVHAVFPALSANYWGRLFGSFSFFSASPDKILSGRVGHWQVLLDFLAREPWHAFLGIGYKTLPYSNFAGATVIADNTFLSLLVETGVIGLTAFISMNIVILRAGWRAMYSSRPEAAFFGEWIFCFWCGQIVQMFSGDLITYWRVWPVYLWVLGAAARQTRERA